MDNPITWCLHWVVLVAGSEKFFLWELGEEEILLSVVYFYDGVCMSNENLGTFKA
jgi:hypothetical protein